MIIYGAADLHLKERIWRSRSDITGDAYIAFARLVRMVMRDPGAVLLLAGDIFDSPYPEGIDELAFSTGMNKLRERGHRVYGIAGNHDAENYYRPLLFGMQELTEEPVDIGEGIMVAGIPYCRSVEKLAEGLANAPVCDILLMHAGFHHLLGFDESWQCDVKDIPEHVDRVLNGHVHVKDVTGKVLSPGSLSVGSVAEFTTAHGVFRFDTTRCQTQWIPIATRPFVVADWNDGPPAIPKPMGNRLPVINLVYQSTHVARVEDFKEKHKEEAHFLDNMQTLETVSGNQALITSEGMDVDRVVRESLARRLGDDAEAAHIAAELVRTEEPARWLEEYVTEANNAVQ